MVKGDVEMKFSVVIPMIFHRLPLTEGLRKAKEADVRYVEIMKWYDEDLKELKKVIDELNMQVVILSSRSYQLGDPNEHQLFLKSLSQAIEAARFLNCRNLLTLVGDEVPGLPRDEQLNNIVLALKEGAKWLEPAGITLNIEPLNIRVDHPGYFLYSSDEAFEIIKKVGSPNVKVLFDIYHQQITEGDLIRRISENLQFIGHFHVAGNPGRHEITTGEIRYDSIFMELDKLNYRGYIGLEYYPIKDPVQSLIETKNKYRSI
jgi:hydroxypyruvate isomerase